MDSPLTMEISPKPTEGLCILQKTSDFADFEMTLHIHLLPVVLSKVETIFHNRVPIMIPTLNCGSWVDGPGTTSSMPTADSVNEGSAARGCIVCSRRTPVTGSGGASVQKKGNCSGFGGSIGLSRSIRNSTDPVWRGIQQRSGLWEMFVSISEGWWKR
ncbi:hypothetical protein BS47DRAFT_449170 [Hydnum rufescens UP504]|uniref:Uncharacterized protein n=1 Tax=Hydnum rufescens UP504 TaxID=1448309 RepID=A0A9P6DXV7_9AGAM|nr:hypothetical protein BS47DRAFT_449170 [Hydnum rufescens UP504]